MMISTICIIAAMAMNMLLAASNYRTIRGYIIFDRIGNRQSRRAAPKATAIGSRPPFLSLSARDAKNSNVFVKPNDQNHACMSFGMARKRA